jgi:hypothetical protein
MAENTGKIYVLMSQQLNARQDYGTTIAYKTLKIRRN